MLLRPPALAGRQQVTHVVRGYGAAVGQQVLGWKQAPNTHQTTGVIRMHMRQGDEVEAAHIVLPEKRGDNLHPRVKAPIVRATTVNKQLMVIGPLDEDGIA